MTDYYRVIARGIAGLDKSSADSRREFYLRARAELELQLCGLDPPLTQSEMMRERLALDEAIRKIEAEAERLPQVDAPDTVPTRPLGPLEQEIPSIGCQEPASHGSAAGGLRGDLPIFCYPLCNPTRQHGAERSGTGLGRTRRRT
jgi:hypothetical protein